MVLSPWRPFETRAILDPHVVHTVGRLEDLAALAALGRDRARPRVVLERLTSMRRHGFSARDLREAAEHARRRHASRGSRCTCRSPRART